jgi:glycine/serine hydroxymethyltransferase
VNKQKNCLNAEHAYVQPHSGADANLVAYWAILSAKVEAPALEKLNVKDPSKVSQEQWHQIRESMGNQRLLGMDYYSGGHLTHGYRRNISGKFSILIPIPFSKILVFWIMLKLKNLPKRLTSYPSCRL